MKKAKIKEALESLGATVKEANRVGWVVSDCPLGPWKHKDGKSADDVFGVKVGTGDPFCNCFACGFHGTMGDLLVEIKYRDKMSPSPKTYNFKRCQEIVNEAMDEFELHLDTPDVEEMFIHGVGKKNKMVFDKWWIKSFPAASEVDWAMDYLVNTRDVPAPLIAQCDIRVDTEQRRVCFPVRDFEGVYRGFHGRAVFDDVEPRYRMYTYKGSNNPVVWLGENHIDPSQPIVIAEGPFDYTSALRVYSNVCCPLFANPNVEKLKRMGHCLEWVTLLDQGTGGDIGRERIEFYMGKDHIIKHAHLPEHRKDAGACTRDEIAEVLGDFVKIEE